jgi:glutamate 5-kinase
VKPQGAITIDDGAAAAIVKNGKSLLPSGIVCVDDDFGVGAPIEFKDLRGDILGIGLVNYSSAEIREIQGLKTNQIKSILGHKSYDEVIHRDNLALFD